MIIGKLLKPKADSNPPVAPIPYIQASITIPRFSTSRILSLVADTGGDRTSLHLRDAMLLIGLNGYKELGDPVTPSGVGGQAKYYQEPAKIVLQHDDGSPEEFNIRILIVALSPEALQALNTKGDMPQSIHEELSWKMRLPSILGRDIIGSFRMVFDCCKPEFYLAH